MWAAHSLTRVIDAYVNGLGMGALGFEKGVLAATGRPSYAPDDLLKRYLYGYWNRIRCSREREAECKRNVEVMWLLGQRAPGHKTIADFRRLNGGPLQVVCAQCVQFLREVELVGGEAPVVAVDGSKFKASASKASLVSAEQAAQQRIAEYLAQLDEADRREEGQAEPDAASIAAALERLRKRDQKLAQAQAELAGKTDYYRTSACAGCENKPHCTRSARRSVARSGFADAAERAHQRAQQDRSLMRLRSETAAPPFGNLKAMLAGGFLLRTLPKVKGEMALAVLTYNLKRALNILGIEELMRKLQMSSVLSSA